MPLSASEIVLLRSGLLPDPPPLDTTSNEAFAASFVVRYEHRLDLFAHEQCGIDLDDWQESVGIDVVAGERRISIRSCHNVGKSTILAIIAIWFLLTRFRCKVVMTAPTTSQLYDALFAETKSWFARMPGPIQAIYDVKSDTIEMRDTREQKLSQDVFLSARTSSKEKPEAMQGVHSDYVLLIIDEASGVDDAVFNAAGGSMASENVTQILTGNPTRLGGTFYRSFRKRGFAEKFKRYHVGYGVETRITEDGVHHYGSTRITKEYAEEVAAEHGIESNEYKVRVLGEFGDLAQDSYIKAKAVEAAMQRDVTVPFGVRPVWIVDPARYGQDDTALGERRGPVIPWIDSKHGQNTMEVAGWIVSKYNEASTADRPSHIIVDVIGIGAGVADRLRELASDQGNDFNPTIVDVNVSESPIDPQAKCVRLRDELWKRFKEKFLPRGKLPEDDQLLEDLTLLTYTYTSDGRLKIESKEELRKRGEKSPDKGDVAVMSMIADDYATVSIPGAAQGSWGTPIKRGIRATV